MLNLENKVDIITGRVVWALGQKDRGPYHIFINNNASKKEVDYTIFFAIPYRMRMDISVSTNGLVPEKTTLQNILDKEYNEEVKWAEEHGFNRRQIVNIV